jgi:hypothetical protein
MTRARRKIHEAAAAKGWTVIRAEWDARRGEWWIELRAPSGGKGYAWGYSWQNAVEDIERLPRDREPD